MPFPRAAAWRAAERLPNLRPLDTAKTGLTPGQKACLARMVATPCLALLIAPDFAAVLLSVGLTGLFALLIAWRVVLVLTGLLSNWTTDSSPPVEPKPIFTLLVPLYDEPAAVPGLAAALTKLDWPADKLDVKLLVEFDDKATQLAIRRASWPQGTEQLTLAAGGPRTKPRALNFGLEHARGDYVAIFDAEDRPSPCQLKDVASAFQQANANCACIQAPLKAYNGSASWIAGHWALEYAVQFGLLVPALCRLQVPVPLGGTSNHFRRDVLEKLGGWDAWNVTEDADLGMRLARGGFRVGFIRSPTLEEAPETLDIWHAQRSRWIKGFIQTWAVMWRAPAAMLQGMGAWRTLAAQLTLGGAILSSLLHGPLALWLLLSLGGIGPSLPPIAVMLCASGYLINAVAALTAPGSRHKRLWLTLTLPLYWPLQSLAAVRAVWELAVRPHAWAKTPHGLTRCTAELTPEGQAD